MIPIQKLYLWSMGALSFISAFSGAAANPPHIGYLYPAGGQRGQEILICAGGQFLQRPQAVYVTGEGVKAEVVKYYRPVQNLQKEERDLIIKRFREVRDKRIAELHPSVQSGGVQLPARPSPSNGMEMSKEDEKSAAKKEEPQDAIKLPEHPLLYDLDNKSLRQLEHSVQMLFMPRSKLQQNRQIAETIMLRVTIAPDAKPGLRQLRIKTALGLTNPIVFQISTPAEYDEMEPNDREAYPARTPRNQELPKAAALQLPVILNGQIMPGDIDRFRFRATAGQQLVVETHARNLIPYLADAVPGWFQAVVALYDAAGTEVAYADDYQFNPDPVLFYKITKTGEYELAIRDSLYRGREDFVYRIAVGELPFITQMFPLGGRQGTETEAVIDGWNLPVGQLPLDTKGDGPAIRQAVYKTENSISNFVPYAVDALPQINESELNDRIKTAQHVKLPVVINGRIDRPDDMDVYRFEGKSGDEINAEVYARRLNSPLDSLLRLTDASGKVLEWNDDYVVKDTGYLFKDTEGWLTHHADSCLTAKLPADGTYFIQIADAQQQGGPAYGYRLGLTAKIPDFELRVTPSSLSPLPGETVAVTVYVLRKDGFDGPIEVSIKNPQSGFKLEGGHIPGGCQHIRMTLKSPQKALEMPIALDMEGTAAVGGNTLTRRVVPAEDMMQAFLYRHLVVSQELLVAMRPAQRSFPSIELADPSPVVIPAGGSARVHLKCKARQFVKEVQLMLQNPPQGVSLNNIRVVPEGLAFTLQADNTVQAGLADNLIIEAFREISGPLQNNKTATDKRQQQSIGVITALPIQVAAKLPK